MQSPSKSDKRLKLKALCLTRQRQKILRQIELNLPQPGITVLLGANGAGKSTLLNVLAGINKSDSGSVEWGAMTSRFMMPEPAAFYPHLTVQEQLRFVAELFGSNEAAVSAALQTWQLNAIKTKRTGHLSLGFRQRLALAQLSVSDADVMLLDEPMNGMDPEVTAVFQQQLAVWKKHKTVVIATHVMEQVTALIDWVVVMNRGQVICSQAHEPASDLIQIYRQAMAAVMDRGVV